jgi:beta-lactamase class A
MHTPLLDYGLLVQKIDKHTKKSYILNAHSVDKLYYTASTIKVVLLGLFLEYCEELLDQETNISLKDKFIGGILYETHTKKISYELLLYLMITISDNTATNIIFETLTQKLGNITIALQQKFHTLHTKFFDLRKQKNTTYIK